MQMLLVSNGLLFFSTIVFRLVDIGGGLHLSTLGRCWDGMLGSQGWNHGMCILDFAVLPLRIMGFQLGAVLDRRRFDYCYKSSNPIPPSLV